MRAAELNYKAKIKEGILYTFFSLFGLFLLGALLLEGFFAYLTFSGQDSRLLDITNWIEWRIDGSFKNSPENIWYQEPKVISIGAITNKVKIGNIAGNRNIEFGVKNIIEEVLQEKDYSLDPKASLQISADIVYLDVIKNSSSFSVFHKDKEAVVIRLKGFLYKEGKLEKTVTVEESADEVSVSTIVIDQGVKFNQQNLSSALKKACNSLVNKLL